MLFCFWVGRNLQKLKLTQLKPNSGCEKQQNKKVPVKKKFMWKKSNEQCTVREIFFFQ